MGLNSTSRSIATGTQEILLTTFNHSLFTKDPKEIKVTTLHFHEEETKM